MDDMTVQYEVTDQVATITLDNGRHNFLNVEMYRQLTEMVEQVEVDDAIKVTVLTGSVGNSFCGGDDLKARPRPIDVTPHWPTRLFSIERTKPVIGAFHGWALGGGFQLAISLTDMRVASTEAKLGAPEIAYGMGGIGGAMRLTRHLPRSVAMQMLLTGDYLTASQAHRLGLVNLVVEADKLGGSARELAERIARHPLIAIQTEMQALDQCGDRSAADALKRAGELYRAQLAIHEAEHSYDELVPGKPAPIDLGHGPGV